MNLKQILIGSALVALLAYGARCSRDPLRTEPTHDRQQPFTRAGGAIDSQEKGQRRHDRG